jgi:hypothetical protein
LAFVLGIGRDFHHGDHGTVDFTKVGLGVRRSRDPLSCRLLFVDDLRVMFGHPLDRTHRHRDPIVFLQLVWHLSKWHVSPKIGQHPLQGQ